ncbi:asparaginase [Fibrella arboris]|uniref:asparaginase n=1 Tax=Fibrella arboris TaxID=3242486 RepID=UPI0035203958
MLHLNITPNPAGSILVIYTGGTLGMVYDRSADSAKTGQLRPFDFSQVIEKVPEIGRLDFDVSLITLEPILDSSDMKPSVWVRLAQAIDTYYEQFDSFVILHGTDTMAYTASALSFMLTNLGKPVILTGAQLPIGVARTDARENLLTALEIAADRQDGRPAVPEVCIYFNSLLLRGNRAKKRESVHFNAFHSENYPHLAMAGVRIEYNRPFIARQDTALPFSIKTAICDNVTILKLFPGITPAVVNAVLAIPGLRGVVLETFGAGNVPTDAWLGDALRAAISSGTLILNVSQCEGGRVTQGHYQTSTRLQQIGVVSGVDMTTEAAITKLMVLLGQETNQTVLKQRLGQSMRGEMSN